MTVQVTRQELTSAALRRHASRARDGAASRRMLAIALVLEGCSRAEAAQACGMDRQTLRDWVHRYNELGLAGLVNKPHGGGARSRLTVAQTAEVAAWIRQGPDVETDGVVRWRLADIAKRIKARFAVTLHERSVGRLLHALGFRRISVRPRHPKADLVMQEAHKKTSPHWSPTSSPRRRAARPSSCGGKMKPGSASKAA